MRKKFLLSHQIENAELLLGRLLRGAGTSENREAWASRLTAMGDFPAAEQLRAATPTIAISDVQGFREAFAVVFQQLQTVSVFDAIYDEVIQAPIRSQIFSGDAFALFEVIENAPIPFSRTSIEDLGELLPLKVGGLVALTQEFLRSMSSEVDNTLNNAFLNAIASATDAALISRLIANAGGATPATSDFADDVKNAAELILGGKAGRLHLIVSPATALEISLATATDGMFLFPGFDLVNGGIVGGLPFHVSDQLPEDSTGPSAILFDATKIAANRGSINIERSQNAAVQFRDDPTNGSAQVVSAFPTNSVILRILRTFGLKMPEELISVNFTGVSNWFA